MTTESASETTALVHSLIPVTISDQWIRLRVQGNGKGPQQVFGALLGKPSGRNLEILNTFEVRTTTRADGVQAVDEEYFTTRALLYKETFPDLEFLGFYTSGDHNSTDAQDESLQSQAKKISESPLLLKMNTAEPIYMNKISLTTFESDPSDETQILFRVMPMKIISELAEQIGLDHMARFSTTGAANESAIAKGLSAHIGAMGNLMKGVKAALEYVKAVQDGTIEGDQEILQDIHKMVKILSAQKTDEFREKELQQAADHKLVLVLSSMVDDVGTMLNLSSKLELLSSERGTSKKHQGRGSSFISSFLHDRLFHM